MRDETAAERDRSADDRDREAGNRDRLAALQDDLEAAATGGDPDDFRVLANFARRRAAADRARAAEDRARAAADRDHAAEDRSRAAAERRRAAERHTEAQDKLVRAATDELTGAWTRRFGLEHITREIERSHRTGSTLVLAFIDIDGLENINDRQGHLAGDSLLCHVVTILRRNVRPYDVIVRYGGDEFLCALPGITLAAAQMRMNTIATTLSQADRPNSISFGIAELGPRDRLGELIDRADAALLQARGRGGSA